MAVILGKRRRQIAPPAHHVGKVSPENSEASDDAEDIQAVFRRHFEAQFKPLDVAPKRTPKQQEMAEEEEGEEAESEAESDWSGLSEAPDAVIVVDHSSSTHSTDGRMSKEERKAFMSSKPPFAAAASTTHKPAPIPTDDPDPDPTESLNLANDLALQRLLSESHLLASTSASPSSLTLTPTPTATPLTPTGRARHLATDLRLRRLGAAGSVHAQPKMPLAHRRGIEAKAAAREARRRREARENGIVLERAVGRGKGKAGGRDGGEREGKRRRRGRERGVDAPGVGRFKGGTLVLSRRDVRSIVGGGGGEGGMRGRGSGRGRGRR